MLSVQKICEISMALSWMSWPLGNFASSAKMKGSLGSYSANFSPIAQSFNSSATYIQIFKSKPFVVLCLKPNILLMLYYICAFKGMDTLLSLVTSKPSLCTWYGLLNTTYPTIPVHHSSHPVPAKIDNKNLGRPTNDTTKR